MAIVIESRTKIVNNSASAITKKSSGATCVVDSSWELVDPNPNIHALFVQFNDEYFEGRLAECEVRWSPRMTLCAGQCHYEGRGGLCSIRLSQALLKFRPRKDLVETLLHEMIHAYLFVTANNKDHDGHGPEFQKIMNRINGIAGTKITIYHNFHAEVAQYQQHWWRCDGPCRTRKPFYGWVKRASNRAPSSNDFWWEEHQRTCGGNYVKVKEPEGYQAKKSTKLGKPFPGEGNSLASSSLDDVNETKSKPKLKNPIATSPVKPTKTLDDYFSKLPGTGHSLSSATNSKPQTSSNSQTPTVLCPVCQAEVNVGEINAHLDFCVSK